MRKRHSLTERVDVPMGAARVAQRRVEPIFRALAAAPMEFMADGSMRNTFLERLMLSCYLQGAVDAIEAGRRYER